MKWTKKGSAKSVTDVINLNVGDASALDDACATPVMNLSAIADKIHSYGVDNDNKTVTVFADYDCDGICSGIIMDYILTKSKVRHTIMFPKRTEGYGVRPENVARMNTDVLITVDNGITAIDAIKSAKDKGMEVLVIDHHLQVGDLPDADIIVDPHVFKSNESNFEDWCGAGLCYELSRMLAPEFKDILVQYAALATVADVVPLLKDNRQIVKMGLKLLNNTEVPALKMLIENAVGPALIDEQTIGFKLGPIINAMGRVEDNAAGVFKFFRKPTEEDCKHLLDVNETRKQLVSDACLRAENIIAEECLYGDYPLVVYDPDTIEGIAGIIAGHLEEKYNIPVIMLTDSSTSGVIKGSGRSSTLNLKETLETVSDVLLGFGGHKGAAGLSLKKENLNKLRQAFNERIEQPEESKNVEEIQYDLDITPDQIESTMEELSKYTPYGEGNPAPVFKITGFELSPRNGTFYKILGVDTIKLFGDHCSALGFGDVNKYNETGLAKKLDLLGTMSINCFMGKSETQIQLIDFQKAETEKKQSALSKLLAEKLKEF